MIQRKVFKTIRDDPLQKVFQPPKRINSEKKTFTLHELTMQGLGRQRPGFQTSGCCLIGYGGCSLGGSEIDWDGAGEGKEVRETRRVVSCGVVFLVGICQGSLHATQFFFGGMKNNANVRQMLGFPPNNAMFGLVSQNHRMTPAA